MSKAATQRFNDWLRDVTKPGVDLEYVHEELIGVLMGCANGEETPAFEIAGYYTRSGQPEIFTFEVGDIVVKRGDE